MIYSPKGSQVNVHHQNPHMTLTKRIGQQISLQYIHFRFLIFGCNKNGLHLTVQLPHYFSM